MFHLGKNKAMIDRKEFLMMCQKNSVYPRSCKIIYHDAEYYPLALYIWFDDKGNPHNTAVIEEVNANSITYGKLQEVEKYEK